MWGCRNKNVIGTKVQLHTHRFKLHSDLNATIGNQHIPSDSIDATSMCIVFPFISLPQCKEWNRAIKNYTIRIADSITTSYAADKQGQTELFRRESE